MPRSHHVPGSLRAREPTYSGSLHPGEKHAFAKTEEHVRSIRLSSNKDPLRYTTLVLFLLD